MIERDGRLDVFREQRDQRLRQRIAKDEFRANDQDLATAHQNKRKVSPHRSQRTHFQTKDCSRSTYLRRQPLKQAPKPLVAHELAEDDEAVDARLEVRVLDARLDDVERRGDGDARDRARDGRDEVLAPRRLVVVRDAHEVFRQCGRAEEL